MVRMYVFDRSHKSSKQSSGVSVFILHRFLYSASDWQKIATLASLGVTSACDGGQNEKRETDRYIVIA